MACSSLLAGLAMNISDCGSEHSLGQALGGEFGLPHGLTIGLVLAETMDRDRRFVPEQFERVADALDEPEDGSGDGSRAVRAVRRILAELEFETLASVGVREDQLSTGWPRRRWPTTSSRSRRRRGRRTRCVGAYRAGLALGATPLAAGYSIGSPRRLRASFCEASVIASDASSPQNTP